MPKRIILEEVYIDRETANDDGELLFKQLNHYLRQIKPRWERLVVVICDEERKVLEDDKKGKKGT